MCSKSVVPLVDLRAQYETLGPEIEQAVCLVLQRGDYILGEDLDHFEHEFARYCGTRYAIGVSSGFAALRIALESAGVGVGDEVITVANTFVATVLAIHHAGATPVLVDVDPATANLDPQLLKHAVTPRTRAIIPVHLYGHPAEMKSVLDFANRHGLIVIEDAAQAHGAEFESRRVGGFGTAGCFSFYPSKNLGAAGDGGMIVTDDEPLAQKARMLRNYGQTVKHQVQCVGTNDRLDTIQAAILRVKLRWLDRWNDRRRAHAAFYTRRLAGLPLETPTEIPGSRHVYHLYVIRTPHRDALASYLGEKGIVTGIHYPVPIHRHSAFGDQDFSRLSFPETERLSQTSLSLPMYAELTEPQITRVCDVVRDFFDSL